MVWWVLKLRMIQAIAIATMINGNTIHKASTNCSNRLKTFKWKSSEFSKLIEMYTSIDLYFFLI
jgi:hypothetical protein